MSQKIDIHGLFIDPETITDLSMQKRIAVFYPVFHEISSAKTRNDTDEYDSESGNRRLGFSSY